MAVANTIVPLRIGEHLARAQRGRVRRYDTIRQCQLIRLAYDVDFQLEDLGDGFDDHPGLFDRFFHGDGHFDGAGLCAHFGGLFAYVGVDVFEGWIVAAGLFFAEDHVGSGGHPHHSDSAAHHAGANDCDWARGGVGSGPGGGCGHDGC